MQALEKSKYEQSLETVRHFIAIAEKELELYHRHIALYGDHAQYILNTISSGGASEASEGTGEPKRVWANGDTIDALWIATEDDDNNDDDDVDDNDINDDHVSLLFKCLALSLILANSDENS